MAHLPPEWNTLSDVSSGLVALDAAICRVWFSLSLVFWGKLNEAECGLQSNYLSGGRPSLRGEEST